MQPVSYENLGCTTYDLQLHGLAIELYCSDFLQRGVSNDKPVEVGARSTYEVDTDGGDVGLGVGIVGKSQQQARLSNTGITDEEELEEIVVSRDRGKRVVSAMLSPLHKEQTPPPHQQRIAGLDRTMEMRLPTGAICVGLCSAEMLAQIRETSFRRISPSKDKGPRTTQGS
jgi:hypothetical protein